MTTFVQIRWEEQEQNLVKCLDYLMYSLSYLTHWQPEKQVHKNNALPYEPLPFDQVKMSVLKNKKTNNKKKQTFNCILINANLAIIHSIKMKVWQRFNQEGHLPPSNPDSHLLFLYRLLSNHFSPHSSCCYSLKRKGSLSSL